MSEPDFDLGLRHKSDTTAESFIAQYCKVFRPHCTVSEDDSFNELEKSITHVLQVKCSLTKIADLVGIGNTSVFTLLDSVTELEPPKEGLEKLVAVAKEINGIIASVIEDMREDGIGDGLDDEEIESIARFYIYWQLNQLGK